MVTREITTHNGAKELLTDRSANHFTCKPGHELGIIDLLPPDPLQKPTPYPQFRTRINKLNKKKFKNTLEKMLQNPKTEAFFDLKIRGVDGHGYYSKSFGNYCVGFFIRVHDEGKHKCTS